MTKLAGDSSEQQDAEIWLLKELSKELGVDLIKKKFDLESGSQMEVDGFCESPVILCEAWSHIGRPIGCQPFKVMSDAFKLTFINKTFFKGHGKCILLFADHDAAAHFEQGSWMAQCLKEYNIEVKEADLREDIRDKVLNAQKRQHR
jgi:hypothetical protein